MRVVGIDWGSTNCRAWLIEDGAILDQRREECGIRTLGPGQFEVAFDRIVEGWRDLADTVLLSGMITSRNGWCETPYVPCPADLGTLLGGARTTRRDHWRLIFLPGLSQMEPAPDVMRGEELQLFGLGADCADATVILPGTHSKWVSMRNGRVAGFRTIMTGELYQLLLTQSLAGRLAEGNDHDEEVFRRAVADVVTSRHPITRIFAARSAVLLGGLQPKSVASYLSGILIGAELVEGIEQAGAKWPEKVFLLGSDTLCATYRSAFDQLGIEGVCLPDASAVSGFSRIARDIAIGNASVVG